MIIIIFSLIWLMQTAQPYKHVQHTTYNNSLPRRAAMTRPTHCHTGQQQQLNYIKFDMK